MSLNADIQSKLAAVKSQVPPPVFSKLEAIFDRLEQASVGVHAPKPPAKAPDVTIISVKGSPVTLESLYADQPLVVLFYRGGWCMFCDLTLRAFDKAVGDIDAAGARLIAVSPQTVAKTEATGTERDLHFDLFSDPTNDAAEAFKLTWSLTEEERGLYTAFNAKLDEANGDDRWELPAPAAFVIARDGTIQWSWVDSNYTHRPEPDDVLAALRQMQKS